MSSNRGWFALALFAAVFAVLLVPLPSLDGQGLGSAAYALILDEGTPLARQQVLEFTGLGVTATNGTGKTVVNIPGGAGSGYQTIMDEGVTLPQQTVIDFVGAGVSVTNDAINSRTRVSISGGGGGGAGTIHFGTSDPNGNPTEITPTNMTNNSTPAPFVASATNSFPGGFDPFRCWDGNGPSNYWIGQMASGFIQIDLGATAAQTPVTYSVQVNNIPEPARAPRDWTLEGSPDGTTFTVIDTVTNETLWSSGQVRTFTIDVQTTPYRFYRWSLTANNGDPQFYQIAKLRVFGPATPFTAAAAGDAFVNIATRQFYGPFNGVATWPLVGSFVP